MDEDELAAYVEEWVQEGIITESQAAEILERYEPAEPRQSRAIVALTLVGTTLVFLGVVSFLAANWSDLPRMGRIAVLIAGPGLAYAGGAGAYARDLPRIGLALSVLGALLVGPSLFLFEDLVAGGVADTWLFLAWTAIALPTGHALGSRAGTGVGLLVLVALVVELVDPANPVPVVGLLGLVLFAVGHTRDGPVPETYRLAGVAISLGSLLWLTTVEGRFGRFELELSTSLFAGLGGVVVGIGWLYGRGKRDEWAWAGAVLLALGGSVVIAAGAPESVPAFVGFVGIHLASVVGILATGYLGYQTRSTRLIDLAVVAALLQTVSFLASTIVDELSGSIALILAGLVLLGVGLVLERGRRIIRAKL